MSLKTLLALSTAAALSFTFTACSDDNSGETPNSCTVKCDGNTAITCDENNNEVKTDCGDNKVCNAGACEEKTAPTPTCDETAPSVCNSGKSYVACVKGEEKTVLCNDGEKCEAGACVPECNDSDPVVCNDATSIKRCQNGKITVESCGVNMICADNACKEDENSKPTVDSLIGRPCTCTGNDCKIIVTGKEIKSVLKGMLATILPRVGININDKDQVIAPNYFSQGITGCEGLVAPEGMAVGCMITDKITFPNSIITAPDKISGLLGMLGGLIDLGDVDINAIMPVIKSVLAGGIDFKAEKGYCMVTNIDLNFSLTDKTITGIIDSDKLNALAGKINTPNHNHEKAKLATCPEGSTLLTYTIDEVSEQGTANVGFDICLRTCQTDADCRTQDGYACVDMPRNQDEVENETKSAKVCFDPSNITYFEEMTKKFDGLIPESGENK